MNISINPKFKYAFLLNLLHASKKNRFFKNFTCQFNREKQNTRTSHLNFLQAITKDTNKM